MLAAGTFNVLYVIVLSNTIITHCTDVLARTVVMITVVVHTTILQSRRAGRG